MEDDGVAFDQQASIHRRQTNSAASAAIALRKRRPPKSVFKIDRAEIFRPVENDNFRSYTLVHGLTIKAACCICLLNENNEHREKRDSILPGFDEITVL